MHEADDQIPCEDDVRVDVAGCACFFGAEVDAEPGGVVEDVEDGVAGGEEAAPGA